MPPDLGASPTLGDGRIVIPLVVVGHGGAQGVYCPQGSILIFGRTRIGSREEGFMTRPLQDVTPARSSRDMHCSFASGVLMALLRALCTVVALAAFFMIGAPLQWLITRHARHAADRIPVFFCRSLLGLLGVRLSIEGVADRGSSGHDGGEPRLVDRHPRARQHHAILLSRQKRHCRWPILSAFAAVQGTVFVDRKRRRTILAANRHMAARMREGRAVLLFPEGTTIGAAEPGPFRSSHFAGRAGLFAGKMRDDRGLRSTPLPSPIPRRARRGSVTTPCFRTSGARCADQRSGARFPSRRRSRTAPAPIGR